MVVRRATLSLESDLKPDPDLLLQAAQGAVWLADMPLADADGAKTFMEASGCQPRTCGCVDVPHHERRAGGREGADNRPVGREVRAPGYRPASRDTAAWGHALAAIGDAPRSAREKEHGPTTHN
jgi:hypothetical protein